MSFNIKRRDVLKLSAVSAMTAASGILLLTRDKPDNLIDNKIEQIQRKSESAIKDSLDKVKNFDKTFSEDVFLTKEKYVIFQSTLNRILRVRKTIGYANFNLVSFDDMLLYAHRFPSIGRFPKAELTLIDEIFFYDANLMLVQISC